MPRPARRAAGLLLAASALCAIAAARSQAAGVPPGLAEAATRAARAAAPEACWPTVTDAQGEAWDREMVAEQGSTASWKVSVSEPTYVVPGSRMPAGVTLQQSNNCLGLVSFRDRLFIGFRTAPFHFASTLTHMFILSSADCGQSWDLEHSISLNTDVREPHFLVQDDQLFFSYFQAGTNPLAFEPQFAYHMRYNGPGQWESLGKWGQAGEIPWQISTHAGVAYASSYHGSHYSATTRPLVYVFLNSSTDGVNWKPTQSQGSFSYSGGVSEVGWSFDLDGDWWGVLRNEDGDTSGWGGRIAHGRKGSVGDWELHPEDASIPWIFESPRMFRHGDELFLVARRDPNGPYWKTLGNWMGKLPWMVQRAINLVSYSFRPHRTSLWRLNRTTKQLEFVFDLPGCGDTAFPAIVRIGKHRYLIANYTSPTKQCANWSWIHGQISTEGTSIYWVEVDFTPPAAA